MSKQQASNNLRSLFPAEEYGIWEVYGEDPNCDFGGNHSQPFLGYFEGFYLDVTEKAVNLPKFFTWGFGGTIEKYVAPTITLVPKNEELRPKKIDVRQREIDMLMKKQEEIQKQLDELKNQNV